MAEARITVENLEMAFDGEVVQRDLNFQVRDGSIFAVMGGSGSGKSTLLRHVIGLMAPSKGRVLHDGEDYWAASETRRLEIRRRLGVCFQSGALWSSMTLTENVTLPLGQFTSLGSADSAAVAGLKLALVGLSGHGERYPAELSGGMRKRAGLARAIALDPNILCFDEPSAGLDPVSARRLDDLILELRDSLGATVILVTHELASIFAIADDGVFLDSVRHTQIARGSPHELLAHCDDPTVQAFLTRGRLPARLG